MNRHLVLTIGALLLAFALGAGGLNLDPIWADELASVTFMGAFDPPYDPAQTVTSLLQYSPDQAPLYFVLGAWWARLVGFSQYALRAFSLLAGGLMIASLYRLAADLLSRRTGLLSALLMATSAFVTLYLHDIRMYAMWMWLVILHCWLYWRLASGWRATRWTWILFAATAALLLYTQFLSAILLAALGAYHLFFARGSPRWREIILCWVIGALMFLPYLPLVLDGIQFQTQVTRNPLGAFEPIEPLLRILGNGFAPLLFPLLVLPLAWKRLKRPAVWHLVFCALLAALLILLLNATVGIITMTRFRYFLFLFFAALTLMAYTLDSLPYARLTIPLYILVWCLAGLHFHGSGAVVDFAGLMARDRAYPPLQDYVFHLRGKVAENDFLLGFTDHILLSEVSYNSSHSTADYYLGAQLGIDGVFLHGSKRQYRLDGDVRSVTQAHPSLLLAQDPSDVPLNYAHALSVIAEAMTPCPPLVSEPTLRIVKYRHPILACDHAAAPVEYENDIRLIDRAALYEADAGLVRVLLWWLLPHESMLDDYNISLQVFGADGDKAQQLDRHLDAALTPWGVVELSVSDLPAGPYQLTLILYERESGAKIGGVDSISGESAKIMPLLDFAIDS